MNKRLKAEMLLFEITAIEEGNFDARTRELLVLINEVLKDARALATYVLDEELAKDKNDIKKAA